MSLQTYLIAPYEIGEQTNLKPWLLPEKAFEELEDCYVWRGIVRKRFGYNLIGENDLKSRLRVNIGNTDGSGNISSTVPGSIFKIGQMFSIGSEIFTVNSTGTPAVMLSTGSATTHTYNTTTGAVDIQGSLPTTPCYFYPAEPVMGLTTRESNSINFEDIIAFDTQFSYRRLAGAWERLGTSIWSGSNNNFFWSTNYRGTNPYETYYYVVNNIRNDQIYYIPQGSTTWTQLRPQLDNGGTRFLDSARIILPFKDRLIVLNTLETESATPVSYVNRCRFSQNGDPTNPTNSWLDDTPGKGGYIDAPTKEQIITAEFIKDRLIVYFERSTWELVYTGNEILPFRWQQINTELGAESTFSKIPFDKGIIAVGNVGIHSCNGVSVNRIDDAIPDEVFRIHNGNDGTERVYGIRDYYRELVYWTFGTASSNTTFPNKILVYNYKNNTWAFFNDSFTCFGNFQKDVDIAWQDLGNIYGTWDNWIAQWNSGSFQSQFRSIVAGNQEGFVVIIDSENSSNSQSLYITDIDSALSELTIIDHNLETGEFILIEECQGITSINDNIFKIEKIDENTIKLTDSSFTGTYTGAGKITRISNISIKTKQYNPGTPYGKQFRFPYIDFLLTRTSSGEISINYIADSILGTSVNESAVPNVLLGNNVLLTRAYPDSSSEIYQSQIWHRYYLQSETQFVQLNFFLSDEQMKDIEISNSFFELQGMLLYIEEGGRLIG